MRKLWLVLLLLSFAAVARPKIGVNIHHTDTDELFRHLINDGYQVVRTDLNYDDNLTTIGAWYKKLYNAGIELEVALYPSFHWDNSCAGNTATIYTNSYNQAYALVDAIYIYHPHVEIMNEMQLRSEINTAGQVVWNSQQDSTAAYVASTCMDYVEAAAKGVADAVNAVEVARSVTIPIILGVVGRDWGFLTHMANVGVDFDEIGYHSYQTNANATVTTDTWFGTGGVVGKLAAFGKPIRLNEFNCGETYDGAFTDVEGSTLSNDCESAYWKHGGAYLSQTTMNLASIVFYEIFNRDGQSGAERYFGLYYSNWKPKRRLAVVQSWLGGRTLSAD